MNKSLGKKILAVLSAAAIPFTTLLSSAPITANAADGYITSQTTQTSLSSHTNKDGKATLPDRSIARDTVTESNGKDPNTDYIKGRTLNYTYTGNIYTANSSLYNYVADSGHDSIAKGYADPYVNLNKAIESTMNYKALYSSASENLTIRFKSTMTGDKNVKVYLFNGSKNNIWDGAAMNYDSSKGEYVYTVKYDDIGFSPTGLIISGRNSNNTLWQTDDIYKNLVKGRTYYYYDKSLNDTGTAEDLYKTSVPLYFGCFYREYEENEEAKKNDSGLKRYGDSFYQDISYNYGADNKGDKTYDGKDTNVNSDFYKNFYWQANMSFRGNYDGAVQGLVDDTLKDGVIAQNGSKLPYFDKDWAKSHSNLVKYWDNVEFPFYEVKIDANKVHGDDDATGKAVYYQFNSRKDNLYFDQSKGKYKETDTQIKSQGTLIRDDNGNQIAKDVRTVSYLPFNDKDSDNGKDNDLGFGTYFDIKFKIRKDGKVDTVDGTGSVNATFEFMGDDDVWVFIDDKLVLDLGGDHKDTTGLIDFAEKTAYANDATKLGYNSNTGIYVGMDNLAKNITKQLTVNLEDVMAEGTFNADGTYNQNMTHTLRMFYMERGMYESDLFVRFNFSAIPNENNLKIREVTRFENINEGLLDLTMKAADYDVFNYTISNEGTTEEDVGKSGILSPTYNSYERNVSQKAVLSGDTIPHYIYLDTSEVLEGGNRWSSGSAVIKAELSPSETVTGVKVEGEDYLFRFDVSDKEYTSVKFRRYNPSTGSEWDATNTVDFSEYATYKIQAWKDNVTLESEGSRYEEHDFIPDSTNAVKNVNYIWTDEFASFTGTDTNGLTGTTDDLGSFNLMYGTDEKESSAEFKRQFKKETDTEKSTMYVNQNDALWIIGRENGDVGAFSKPEENGRTVSEYYNTTVTVKDSKERLILSKGSNDNPAQTQYSYKNGEGADENDPVQLIETFVNKPNVGAITVTKQLNPNDNVTDSFAFTISLYDVFGVEGMNVTDYSNIKATVTKTNGKSETTPLGNDGAFTLQCGETLTIQGVPYGTKYTVTETPAKDYTQQSTTADGEQKVYTGTFDNTTTEETKIIPAEANQETVVNTRKTGSLKLSKVLEGDYSKTNIKDNTPFDFEVTFTAPTGVDLANYTFETDPAGIVITNNYKFTVSVKENQPVEISGIPYGTTYTVKETTVLEENWSNDGEQSGEIGETASTATITNTYTPPAPKYGSLKVSKNVLGANGLEDITQEMKEQKFTFTVTLFSGDDAVNDTFTASTGSIEFKDGSATFTLCDDESIEISNIPIGYTYTVKETVNAEYDTTFESETGTIEEDGVTGTIAENVIAEVKFTNTKKFIPYTLPESGFEDTRMYFVFALSGMMLCGLAYFLVNRKKISN